MMFGGLEAASALEAAQSSKNNAEKKRIPARFVAVIPPTCKQRPPRSTTIFGSGNERGPQASFQGRSDCALRPRPFFFPRAFRGSAR